MTLLVFYIYTLRKQKDNKTKTRNKLHMQTPTGVLCHTYIPGYTYLSVGPPPEWPNNQLPCRHAIYRTSVRNSSGRCTGRPGGWRVVGSSKPSRYGTYTISVVIAVTVAFISAETQSSEQSILSADRQTERQTDG